MDGPISANEIPYLRLGSICHVSLESFMTPSKQSE